jgi:hypothetical protein
MALADTLAPILAKFGGRAFAVIDGARLPDIRSMLTHLDIAARSLFIEHRDPEIVAAGPFLAALDERRARNLAATAGIEQSVVWWFGDVQEPVLFRHLRGINTAIIPRPAEAPSDPYAGPAEMVLFRHWDPSVLSMMLPILEPSQSAKVFGPMRCAALFDEHAGETVNIAADEAWGAPNRGWLRLSSEQMERIKETMQARSHGRIARYLRETAGSCLVSMGRTQLQDFVVAAESRGRAIGLRTERGLGQFAFLELVSQGTFAASDRARQFLRSGPGTPDQSMNELLVAMTDTCRRMQHQ